MDQQLQHHQHQLQQAHHQHHQHLQQQQPAQQIIQQPQLIHQQQQTNIQQNDNPDEMMQQLMILVRETQETDNMVQMNRDVYQNLVIHLQNRSRIMSFINHADCSQDYPSANIEHHRKDLHAVENLLKQKAGELNRIRARLIAAHCHIYDRLIVLQNKTLFEYLPKWHHEQQLINNGVKIETIKLDTIQQWIEKIVDIIWRIKNQIKGLQLTLTGKPNVQFNTDDLEKFVVCINKALENLILNAFVVEKQPPQVMKTNTRFTATVRFLCGNKLNVQLINPTVKALILSESNARTVIRYHKQLIENSWTPAEGYNLSQSMMNQQQQQQHHGVILSPAQSLAPTPQPTMLDQQQQQHMNYTTNLIDNHANILAASPEQPMSLGDHQIPSPSQQQFFQQQHPPQPQQNQQAQMAAVSNMTAQHQYGSITEIGYNPDVPIHSKDFECSGEILNNSNILEFQETTGHMISHFKNMQLKKIKRTEKKGTESVMDEKFVLLFFTEFRLADDSFWPYSIKTSSRVKRGDLLFHILAFSLPVVVIVHGNQEPHAWATVTWHNAFARPDELLYQVPDKVPWRELGRVLSEKFRSCAGRGLSIQNLKYLASKVYRNQADSDDILVTWNQFAKEPLSDKSFTFWEWFHSILKLTKEHLRDLWRAERIFGFIGKKGCVDLLLGSAYSEPVPVGTFLLRYSETELGGITIAWVSNSSELSSLNPSLNDRVQISQRLSPTNKSSNVLMHLQPFVGTDLKTRSLADRIRDLKDLVYLYPNIPKNEAFEAYYTPINNTNHVSATGYIRPMLVTTLAANYPRTVGSTATTEPSTTPNSVSQSSPEGCYEEGISMNEMMDSSYPPYDSAVGEYNYTIQ